MRGLWGAQQKEDRAGGRESDVSVLEWVQRGSNMCEGETDRGSGLCGCPLVCFCRRFSSHLLIAHCRWDSLCQPAAPPSPPAPHSIIFPPSLQSLVRGGNKEWGKKIGNGEEMSDVIKRQGMEKERVLRMQLREEVDSQEGVNKWWKSLLGSKNGS